MFDPCSACTMLIDVESGRVKPKHSVLSYIYLTIRTKTTKWPLSVTWPCLPAHPVCLVLQSLRSRSSTLGPPSRALSVTQPHWASEITNHKSKIWQGKNVDWARASGRSPFDKVCMTGRPNLARRSPNPSNQRTPCLPVPAVCGTSPGMRKYSFFYSLVRCGWMGESVREKAV